MYKIFTIKYKLINKQTNEEHLCDKVTIDGFDYYVSDEQPEEFCIRYVNNNPFFMIYDKGVNHKQLKIIATNNPNIDIPKVVDEIERLSQEYTNKRNYLTEEAKGFYDGYNKSQATHPFSEEDMVEFGKWLQMYYVQHSVGCYENIKTHTIHKTKELLQLWKEQRTKTVYYE